MYNVWNYFKHEDASRGLNKKNPDHQNMYVDRGLVSNAIKMLNLKKNLVDHKHVNLYTPNI